MQGNNNLGLLHLRQQLNQTTNDLNRYKAGFQAQIDQKAQLQLELADLRNQNANLTNNINLLQRSCENLKKDLSKFKLSSHYKSYSELNSKSGKQKRRGQCRDVFYSVCSSISDISSASFNLQFGNDKFNFMWKRDNQHQVANQSESENDEDNYNVSHGDKFNSNGQFVSQYLRSIIYVMDKHKISHEAYHEVRMVTNGIMPPIHTIKREKSTMSEEIEYIKHPTVGNFSIVL